MNHFRTPSKLTRAVAAAAALFSTVLIVSAVVGLAEHYNANPMQMASRAAGVVASR